VQQARGAGPAGFASRSVERLEVLAACRAAAEHILPLLDRSQFKGVCYFDEGERAWMVVDLQGRRKHRHSSPIRESEAFTIFDEARCRGADLQLRLDAVGLLTLGPTTCKDKLMQAAGRLRKLGKGQTLRIVGTADVTAKIGETAGACASGPLTSLDVLQWVMHNTEQATQRSVLEWSHQGLLFAATRDAPEHALQPELLDLEELYGSSRSQRPVADVVQDHCERHRRDGLAGNGQLIMEAIIESSKMYGASHMVVSQAALGEECERELEREEEQEEEVERQVPRVAAASEEDWDYSKALDATSLQDLVQQTGLKLLPLKYLAAKLQPESMGAIRWSPQVFCTRNFALAIQQPAGGGALNEYLRPVDALLLLPGSEKDGPEGPSVLLLSERECNALLELQWQAGGSRSSETAVSSKQPLLLTNLCFAYKAQGSHGLAEPSPPLAVQLGGSGRSYLAGGELMPQLVSLALFNGETTYVDQGQAGQQPWEVLRELPQLRQLRALVKEHGAVAEAVVAMRGKQVLLSRSQLEQACDPERHAG
jgi:hypothetical protein